MLKLISLIIRSSIIPASLMVVSKVVGLYTSFIMINSFPYITNEIGGMFSIHLYFSDPGETLIVNSISNIFMLTVLSIFTFVLFIKYFTRKAKEEKPTTLYRFTDADLLKQITDKKNNFIKLFIAAMFLIISNLTVVAGCINGSVLEWLLIPCIILLFLCIWGIIRIADSEINKFYPNEDNKAWK